MDGKLSIERTCYSALVLQQIFYIVFGIILMYLFCSISAAYSELEGVIIGRENGRFQCIVLGVRKDIWSRNRSRKHVYAFSV
jgi:hypothetical protein